MKKDGKKMQSKMENLQKDKERVRYSFLFFTIFVNFLSSIEMVTPLYLVQSLDLKKAKDFDDGA